MTEKRVYQSLPYFTREEAEVALAEDDVEKLKLATLAIGMYDPGWKYAQDFCLKLADHPNKTVRGNVVLGLAYVARFHGTIEKHLVKPVLLRARRDSEAEVRMRAGDAIEDINHLMKWRIGQKPQQSYKDEKDKQQG